MSNFLVSLPTTAKVLLTALPLYVFLLKFCKAEQARKINQISKEVFDINSLCVEFYIKYHTYLLLPKLKLDYKDEIALMQQLHIIRFRIATHMSNIEQLTRNFHFGSPINYLIPYIWYEKIVKLMEYQHFTKLKTKTHRMVFEDSKNDYFDSIYSKDIFKTGVSLDWDKDKVISYLNSIETSSDMKTHDFLNKLPNLFSTNMEDIVNKGVDMVALLDDKAKKALW